MATITGTAGGDSLSGTNSSDTINGLDGNDTLRGLGGNDTLRGGNGHDSLLGGANNDVIYGEAGNDTILGEAGGDLLLDGGLGNDSVSGGDGDDNIYFRVGEGFDTLDGGAGIDTLTIEVASAQLTAGARADFQALSNWIDSPSGPLTLANLGLMLSGIETLTILLDGQVVDIGALRNSAPVADANFVMAYEDEVASGELAASDPDGDVLVWSLLQGPSQGTLQLDADGRYTYLAQNGFSGSDSFLVRIRDAAGLTLDQTVDVWVAPIADTPVLNVAAVTVALSSVKTGTAAGDVLTGERGNDTIDGAGGNDLIIGDDDGDVRAIPLAITAVSSDPDGSETVQVRISGLPAGAALSAGTQNADGSWTLETTELDGLMLLTALTGDITLQVQALATEFAGEGDVGVATALLPISVQRGPGHDLLQGGAGNDTIFGGEGDDRIHGGSGADVIHGDDGNDVIRHLVDGARDIIAGDAGIDTVEIALTAAQLTAAVRNDLAALDAWRKQLVPGREVDGPALTLPALGLTLSEVERVVILLDGVEVEIAALLSSAPKADPLVGIAAREDTAVTGKLVASDADGDPLSWAVLAGPQRGTLHLDASGAYRYIGHANVSGSDAFTVVVRDPAGNSATQRVEVAIAAVADAPELQAAVATGAAMAPSASMIGSDADDTLTGTAGADLIEAGDGNDLVRGDGSGGGAPVGLEIVAALRDVDGSETLSIRVSGLPSSATLSAGTRQADGSWTLAPAELAGLTLSAAAGSSFELTVAATATEATGDAASTLVRVPVTVGAGAGGAGNDTIRGEAGNDTIYGGGGDDLIRGGWGNDTLFDEAGNDHVRGGKGNDVIHNGAGNDEIWAGKGNDVIHDGAGDDEIHGDKGNDLIVAGAGNNRYFGGSGCDTLDLSAIGRALTIDIGKHTITGGGVSRFDGIEKVIGTAHDDILIGDKDWNVLEGGAGNDVIRGGAGDDKLSGGAGRDTFTWVKDDIRHASTDRITDFGQGDRLDLRALLKGLSYQSLNSVVQVSDSTWGTTVSVKLDGKVHEVARLEGFHATSAIGMLAAEMILV